VATANVERVELSLVDEVLDRLPAHAQALPHLGEREQLRRRWLVECRCAPVSTHTHDTDEDSPVDRGYRSVPRGTLLERLRWPPTACASECPHCGSKDEAHYFIWWQTVRCPAELPTSLVMEAVAVRATSGHPSRLPTDRQEVAALIDHAHRTAFYASGTAPGDDLLIEVGRRLEGVVHLLEAQIEHDDREGRLVSPSDHDARPQRRRIGVLLDDVAVSALAVGT
jgi:hypothetical protein